MKKFKRLTGDEWCLTAEIPQATLFVMSVPLEFIGKKWPSLGLGDKCTAFLSHFKKDFCTLWYRRKEFDASAEFISQKMVNNPKWALQKIDEIEDASNKLFLKAKYFSGLDFQKDGPNKISVAWKDSLTYQKISHGLGAGVSWHADADEERVTNGIRTMLEKQISNDTLDLALSGVFATLSTSNEDSFAQKEEKDFLKMTLKIEDTKNAVKIFNNSKNQKELKNKLKESESKLFKLLLNHAQKWAWLPYAYKGPGYNLEYFLKRWKNFVKNKQSANAILNDLKRKKQSIQKEQTFLIKKLKLSSHQKDLIKMAQRMVFIKDYRKGALYYGSYAYEKFFRWLAKKNNLKLEHIWIMSYKEILNLLEKNQNPGIKKLNSRLQETAIYIENEEMHILEKNDAHNIFNKIKKEKIDNKNISELKGTPACVGYAKGIVKIIEVPQDMSKMKQGDILVSETTYPSLVPAMKKAAAIVTNAGGLTCHAAIVSRELGIPCIVGTKIANKILQDGDLVEVDADRGVVKIIKKN